MTPEQEKKKEYNKQYSKKNRIRLNAYRQAYYHANKEKVLAQRRARYHIHAVKFKARDATRRAKHKAKIDEIKAATGCKHCGERDPIVLVHHHTEWPRPKGSATIGTMLMKSWGNIQTELDKCIVLCANCHTRVHHSWNSQSNTLKKSGTRNSYAPHP